MFRSRAPALAIAMGIGLLAVSGSGLALDAAPGLEVYQQTLAGQAPGDEFGLALAVDEGTMAIGARTEDGTGAVHVYERNSTLEDWKQTDRLSENPDGSGHFGQSLDLEGDTLVVGNPGPEIGENSVHVFERTDEGWTLEATFRHGDPGLQSDEAKRLGSRVAVVDASTVAASAPADDPGLYVFEEGEDGWSLVQSFGPGTLGGQSAHPTQLAADNDTLVLGGGRANVGPSKSGVAIVFDRADGEWTVTQRLRPADPDAGDRFGNGLSIQGNLLAVGAPLDEAADGPTDTGVVHLFEDTDDGFERTATVAAPDGAPGDRFGRSVDLDGDRLRVGSPFADVGNASQAGEVDVFHRSPGSWDHVQNVTNPDPGSGDGFGWDIDGSQGAWVTGARFDDTGNGAETGAAHAYQTVGADTACRAVPAEAVCEQVPGTPGTPPADDLCRMVLAGPICDLLPTG